MLQLTKPLAVIDLETTGLNLSSDRTIEIAIVKIMPDGKKISKRKLINPEMPIPPASSEIHGITNDMVKDAPTFKQVANELKQFIEHCDLAGYNSNRFDIPMLAEEFLRLVQMACSSTPTKTSPKPNGASARPLPAARK